MCKYLKEACVESLKEALDAQINGADRIELCSRLDLDGLSPSIELYKTLKNQLNIPIKVMIRPRTGDFLYNRTDIRQIFRTLDEFIDNGTRSFVFGAIKNGRLDIKLIQKIAEYIYPGELTIHKAIDSSSDPINDINRLKEIPNVVAILSSGQKDTASQGTDMLVKMKNQCHPEISLIPAGKITRENIEFIHDALKCKEYHGRKIV